MIQTRQGGFTHKLLRIAYERKLRLIALLAGILLLAGFLGTIALPATTYAGGGVGSGGNGTGACSYVCTLNGYAWAVYPMNSGGPSGSTEYATGYHQFRDGSTWSGSPSSPYNVCSAAGAGGVAVFIIYDSNGYGVGYNYLSSYNPPYEITSGPVDHNRASAITTAAAQAAYNSVPNNLKSGYTWGSNVGWFCYDVPANGAMNGFDVNTGGGSEGSGFGATITVDGSTSSTSNPYFFNSLPPGTHKVTATAPNGYMVVASAWCDYPTACGAYDASNPPQSQNYVAYGYGSTSVSTTITVTSNSTVQMRWVYAQPVVQIHVFEVTPSGQFLKNVSGSVVSTCGSPNITTDSSGFGYLTLNRGAGYCLRINSGTGNVDPGGTGPFARPWGEGYAGCGGFGGPPYSGYCSQYSTYECQVAGEKNPDTSPNSCGGNANYYDRTWDGGFDFVYVLNDTAPQPTAQATCTINGSTISATLTVTAYDSTNSQDATTVSSSPAVTFTQNGNTFTGNITNYAGFGAPTFTVTASDLAGSNTTTATLQPCVHVSCSIQASNMLVGTPNTIKIIATYNPPDNNPPSPSNYTMSMTIAGPTGTSGPHTGMDPGATNTTASYTYTYTPPATGQYTVSGSFYGTSSPYSSISATCPPVTFNGYNEPYVRAYGNDVIEGGDFTGGNCSNLGTGIQTYNNGGSPNYAGSGGQFGANAMAIISGFASASLREGGGMAAPNPPKGLSFSNTVGAYGGSFGGTNCIHDWYNDVNAANASPLSPGSTLNMVPYFGPGGGSVGSGAYRINSSVELDDNNPSNRSLHVGKRLIFYVSGNVYIHDNLVFDTAARASLGDIQSFWLVVQGNIYIDPSVTQLDGVYVAEPSGGSGGNIYTCANSSGPWPVGSISDTDPNNCASTLTVNGAFIAKYVDLLRSDNSLPAATPNELPPSAGGTSKAAEIFNFSSETYLAPPAGLGSSGGGKYDAITELPPVL